MATQPLTADEALLKPAVLTGRHPSTGVVHRLIIKADGSIRIERKPYVSDHADGWTKTYDELTCQADKHIWLINAIRQNPCDW